MAENKAAKSDEIQSQLSLLSISPSINPSSTLPMNGNNSTGYDSDEIIEGIAFVDYEDESQLEDVMRLVGTDLSEPYSSKPTIFYISILFIKIMGSFMIIIIISPSSLFFCLHDN